MIYHEMQQASWKIRENNGEKSRGDFFLKKELRIALSRKYNPVERFVMILLWQCMRNASSSSKYTAKKRGEFKADRGGKQLPETYRIKQE